ncbi:MAG: anthranilate phosphoribosyltransferase [Gammaproteobacteria bacterium]|nr:anthranilate phosphoribosyltransferase [Gammaproteobacteria bacterium]
MDMQSAIRSVTEGVDLSGEDMQLVMRRIMTGEATQAQIGGFLIGLRMKGETVDEIAGAAAVMRELATKVDVDKKHLVDTCGTGGDGSKTFNISTASAIVVAAAGGRVAKHGNRSISSKSGSADVLEAMGVNIGLSPEQVANCINEVGVGFMFAPNHHSAMKHAIGPRKEMGVRTIFNLLGPLTNPASAPNQVIGVFGDKWVVPVAKVLAKLGSQHVLVVHGEDGMDELSITAPTQVAELKNGNLDVYTVTPEQFGLASSDASPLEVADAKQSKEMIQGVLNDTAGPGKDIVCLNAGAAIYVAGLAASIEAGIKKAQDVIENGAAKKKLEALVKFSNNV